MLVSVSVCNALAQRAVVYEYPKSLIEIGSSGRFYIDNTNKLSFSQISQFPENSFNPIQGKTINLGFSHAKVWLKFDLENLTNETLYAMLLAQDVDYVDAFVVGNDTTYSLETGSMRPFERRYFAINTIVLNLGKQPKQLYFALKDMNGLVFQIKVGSVKPITEKIYSETLINAFVMGVMILIVLFSFFMYVSLKDNTYLLYAVHIIFAALTFLSFEGYLFDFLWRDMPFMNNGINSSLIRLGTLLTSIWFSVSFLNIRKILPKIHRYFIALGWLATIIVLTKLIGILKAEMAFNVIIIITFASFLSVGLWLYNQGFRPARFYLIGWGIYIVEILMVVLTLFNVLSFEHFYTYYGYHIGAVFQAILLTFALMDRINSLQKENRESQDLAMSRLSENERLMASHALILEQQLEQPQANNTDISLLLKAMRDQRERVKKISISTMDGVLLFPVEDIVRIEAMGSYANVHFFNRQKMLASRSLSDFEQQLKEYENFFKVHKSHLINMNYVTKYIRGDGGYVVMEDGSEVDVSRRAKSQFLRAMGLEN